MTVLCDSEIADLCVGGMVKPFDRSMINPASLDLRLGDRIMIESAQSSAMITMDLRNMGACEADPYLLVPGQFILAETVEVFNLPHMVAGQFMLKSSRAREGLQHLLAGWCDPGWCGSRLTLELKNIRQLHPISLWPGMRIGQMKFQWMSKRPAAGYELTGRYNGDMCVTGSKG